MHPIRHLTPAPKPRPRPMRRCGVCQQAGPVRRLGTDALRYCRPCYERALRARRLAKEEAWA